jgi:hypothetical protein
MLFPSIHCCKLRRALQKTDTKGGNTPRLRLLRLLGGSPPRADRARCQLANPTTPRRQGVAEAVRWGFHCGREGHRGLHVSFL